MFTRADLQNALDKLDSRLCEQLVGAGGLRDAAVARKFVNGIRESGCLVLKHPNEKRELERDRLVGKCREFLSGIADSSIVDDFEAHVEDARVAERGFREILSGLNDSSISQFSPQAQAWGIIHRALDEFVHLQGETTKLIDSQRNERGAGVDPRQLKFKADSGAMVSPDAVLNAITQGLGMTLFLLAYAHQWFDKNTGVVLLPPEITVDDSLSFKSGTHLVLSSGWRELERAWDRSRLFKSRLGIRKTNATDKDGRVHDIEVLETVSPKEDEILDRIAQDRLQLTVFQQQMHLKTHGVRPGVIHSVGAGRIPFPPNAYISEEELVAYNMLTSSFCVPVEDDSQHLEGLTLKVWLRGYAYYALLANSHDSNADPLIRTTEAELTNGLVGAGLSTKESKMFITLTKFQRGSLDLFDTPLLISRTGAISFFVPAYSSPVLCNIMLSRISALKRHRAEKEDEIESDSFQNKGAQFELRALKLFRAAGLPAHTFKYQLGGAKYQCDLAVILDEILFVFECKNFSLPHGNLVALYYYLRDLDEAAAQVERITHQFDRNPEIVRNNFGANAAWQRVVPCVLQALPWSAGRRGNVYFYDNSALTRFLEEGYTSIGSITRRDGNHFMRRHKFLLRKADIPTARELLEEIDNPRQLRLAKLGWEIVVTAIRVSDRFVLGLPEWRQRPLTTEEQIYALSSGPEEALRAVYELTHGEVEVPVIATSPDDRTHLPTPLPLPGRNEPCVCGSGKKFKKCCLHRFP